MKTIKTFKGFDKNMMCRNFKYQIGGEYEESGAIAACNNGFHACERPLDVFSYYPPATSRYCEVEQSGMLDRDGDDSKVASSKIKIGAEIGIPGLIKAQIEYVKAHTTMEHTDAKFATAGYSGAATAGDRGAATAGDRGAATAGYSGAATAGYSGAATAGDRGAATAGDRGAATAGDYGAATARGSVSVGANGVGLVRGNGVKARGGKGAILVIAIENESDYDISEWRAFTVDGEKVKADTWYTIKNGELVACDKEVDNA